MSARDEMQYQEEGEGQLEHVDETSAGLTFQDPKLVSRTPHSSVRRFASSQSRLTYPVATGAWVVVAEKDEELLPLVQEACGELKSDAHVVSFLPQGSVDQYQDDSDAIVFPQIGIAVIDHRDAQASNAMVARQLEKHDGIEEAFPEFYVFADAEPYYSNTEDDTWGRQATGIPATNYTGHGIRVAVLDTGIDAGHPDLAGRIAESASFVQGESVDDGNGHGTHCAGTIAGIRTVTTVPRYCAAPDARLVIGKVLSNAGVGKERSILQGMLWAIDNGAHVVSMSLGSPIGVGQTHNPAYERAAEYARDKGSLVVAAAGNDSYRRLLYVAPVSSPANSPSVVAVAAIDHDLAVAGFSNGGINQGSPISVAAPGVNVVSSWPRPRSHRLLSGTSMACPHVAGIAALWAQSDEGLRGTALANMLETTARNVGGLGRDVGHGLVQAP